MPQFTIPNSGELREYNDCHVPAGSPTGGQFCSQGGGAVSGGPAGLSTAFAAAQAAYGQLKGGDPRDRTSTHPFPQNSKDALRKYGEMYRVLQGWGQFSKRELAKRGIPPPSRFTKRKSSRVGRAARATSRGVTKFFDWGPEAQNVWW